MSGQKKMVKIKINETSGVDNSAHLVSGWAVMKAADNGDISKTLATLSATQEENMPTDKERLDEAQAALAKSADEVEALKAANASLEAEKAAAVAKAAGDGADPSLEVLKALPANVQKMFEDRDAVAKAAEARVEALSTEIAKAREVRADEASIAMVKSFGSLAFTDVEAVGKSLRQISDTNPDLAKSLTEMLGAVNEQVKTAALFSTVGKSATSASGGAYEKLDTMAKAAAINGKSYAKAFSEVTLANQDLYTQYQAELAGN